MDKKQLKELIEKEKSKGTSVSLIRDKLIAKGYPAEIIDDVLDLKVSVFSPSKVKLLVTWIVVCCVLAAGFYFLSQSKLNLNSSHTDIPTGNMDNTGVVNNNVPVVTTSCDLLAGAARDSCYFKKNECSAITNRTVLTKCFITRALTVNSTLRRAFFNDNLAYERAYYIFANLDVMSLSESECRSLFLGDPHKTDVCFMKNNFKCSDAAYCTALKTKDYYSYCIGQLDIPTEAQFADVTKNMTVSQLNDKMKLSKTTVFFGYFAKFNDVSSAYDLIRKDQISRCYFKFPDSLDVCVALLSKNISMEYRSEYGTESYSNFCFYNLAVLSQSSRYCSSILNDAVKERCNHVLSGSDCVKTSSFCSNLDCSGNYTSLKPYCQRLLK